MGSDKTRDRLTETLLETAVDLHRLGIMDDAAYTMIVHRHQDEADAEIAEPIPKERADR